VPLTVALVNTGIPPIPTTVCCPKVDDKPAAGDGKLKYWILSELTLEEVIAYPSRKFCAVQAM